MLNEVKAKHPSQPASRRCPVTSDLPWSLGRIKHQHLIWILVSSTRMTRVLKCHPELAEGSQSSIVILNEVKDLSNI